MTTKLSVVNEHCTSFMGGIWDISPRIYDPGTRTIPESSGISQKQSSGSG
jgi:hypothetical protein